MPFAIGINLEGAQGLAPPGFLRGSSAPPDLSALAPTLCHIPGWHRDTPVQK